MYSCNNISLREIIDAAFSEAHIPPSADTEGAKISVLGRKIWCRSSSAVKRDVWVPQGKSLGYQDGQQVPQLDHHINIDELLISLKGVSSEEELYQLMTVWKGRLSLRLMVLVLNREKDWQRALALHDWMIEKLERHLLGITIHIKERPGDGLLNCRRAGTGGYVADAKWWMSFDDKQVQAYDLKNLEKDCFGGKFTVDVYDNFLKTNSPQEYDKPNSAYMLLYERARSEVLLDSPAPSANSCIKDEDGDALMKEIQQVESTEKNTYIEMPPSIHLCVWKENLKFVHEMHLLDKDYFRFLLKLVEANVDLIDSRAVKCQSGGKQGLVRRYILEALIEAKDEASRHPKSCLHFWELLGQLLFNIEDPEEYSLAQKQLDDELHWLETAPAAVDEEDKLMEGHLLLTRVLVEILDCRIIGSSKVPHGRRSVYKLISTFLFPESTFLWHDEETNGNSIPSGVQFGIIGTYPESDRVFQSKCATRASRDKAFQLLICLVTHCIESLHELVELLVKIHFTDDLVDWEQPSSYGQKTAGGYVGLKNGGATCYMNSVFQQFFMQPEVEGPI